MHSVQAQTQGQPGANTVYEISATADGQFHSLALRAQHDTKLEQSLISHAMAVQSKATVFQLRQRTIVIDSSGRSWTGMQHIRLRWHYVNESQSFEELFVVVEGPCLLPAAPSQTSTATQAGDNSHTSRPGNDSSASNAGALDVLFKSSIPRPLNADPATDSPRTYRIIERPETSSQRRERLERERVQRKRSEIEAERQARMARGGLEEMKGVLRGEIDRRGKGGKGG